MMSAAASGKVRTRLAAGGSSQRANPSLEWGEFPASWENTGNSSDSGLGHADLPGKKAKGSTTYKQNSLRHGTGN